MVAQDTGSAIIGPARADIYFGAGDDAGRVAGRIRQQGRFTMLIPHDFDRGQPREFVPLPVPKPVLVAVGAGEKSAGKPTLKSRQRGQSLAGPRPRGHRHRS
jgi:membrane-bound lytic murein transglycosylase A